MAIGRNTEVALAIDVDKRTFASPAIRTQAFGSEIAAELTCAGPEQRTQSTGGFRFFADGSSTCGGVHLRLRSSEAKICVNWLTGEAQLGERCWARTADLAAQVGLCVWTTGMIVTGTENRIDEPHREAGFTVVEAVVALTILAVALGVLLNVMSNSIRQTGQAEAAAEAGALAQSLPARIGTQLPLQDGQIDGQSEHGFRWRLQNALHRIEGPYTASISD